MARAQGARAQMALAFETVYGTPPASGYTRMPFASTSLGSEQPLLSSELLGYGRDPRAPIKDAVTADGDVVVPIDAEAFGFWLKAAFGEPTTTGTGPWTHEFRSGSWTLPSMSIETAMPEVPRFAMYSGCVLDQLSWQMQRSGLLTATARLVAQGETVATTSAAGTPAEPALKRFGHFNGSITRNGAALGNVVSAEITYANNLDRIETIRSDGRIDGADPSIAALTGRVEVRFADQVLVNQAIAGDPCELEFAYALPSGESFTFTVHAVYLPRPRIEIAGPQGVQATFDWQAARDASSAACAPPPSSTMSRSTDHAATRPTAEPRWLDLGHGVRLRVAPLTTALMVAARADLAVEALPETAPPRGAGARLRQGDGPPRRPRLGGGRRRRRQSAAGHARRLRRAARRLAGLRGVPGRLRRQGPVAGSGKKRLRALAEWHFGGGDAYCAACAQACPDCPARLNRPVTPRAGRSGTWRAASAASSG